MTKRSIQQPADDDQPDWHKGLVGAVTNDSLKMRIAIGRGPSARAVSIAREALAGRWQTDPSLWAGAKPAKHRRYVRGALVRE